MSGNNKKYVGIAGGSAAPAPAPHQAAQPPKPGFFEKLFGKKTDEQSSIAQNPGGNKFPSYGTGGFHKT